MCNDKYGKHTKGDEHMAKVFETLANKKENNYKDVRISNEAIEKLTEGKSVIKCKDGVAQINENHPDYKFWMED